MSNHNIKHYFTNKFSRILTSKNKSTYAIQLDITNYCNLSCSHCYHTDHTNKKSLKLDDWFKILNIYEGFIDKYNYNPYFVICGGEPLTNPNIFKLLHKINDQFLNAPIYILTNGTLFNDINIRKFKNINNLNFQISLDGPDSLSHDYFRGKGSFNKTLDGINKLNDNGFNFIVQSVLSKRTSNLINNFFELARKCNFPQLNFTRFIEEGYGKKLSRSKSDRALRPHELKKAYIEILFSALNFGVKTSTNLPLMHLIDRRLGTNSGRSKSIVINYQGYVKASSRIDLILGHIFEEGLEKIVLENENLKKLRNNQINVCGSCKFIKKCGGDRNAAFSDTGSILGFDPGCWFNLKRRETNE
jgi:AdoMet-dependent heme synthase